MSILVLNSFSSSTERLQYPLDKDPVAYSTIPSTEVQKPSIVPDEDLPGDTELEGALFGTHIREAIAIVKDWTSSK
jgi:hypothetical protein